LATPLFESLSDKDKIAVLTWSTWVDHNDVAGIDEPELPLNFLKRLHGKGREARNYR